MAGDKTAGRVRYSINLTKRIRIFENPGFQSREKHRRGQKPAKRRFQNDKVTRKQS